jgi:small-conductance mechanosensitive channel
VLFKSYGDSARNICVRWWIEDYRNDTRMLDKVNSTLEIALAEANIEMPFDTYKLNVSMQPERTDKDSPGDDRKVEDTPN